MSFSYCIAFTRGLVQTSHGRPDSSLLEEKCLSESALCTDYAEATTLCIKTVLSLTKVIFPKHHFGYTWQAPKAINVLMGRAVLNTQYASSRLTKKPS